MSVKLDKIGPFYVVEVTDPAVGMRGILVIDNTVRGPGKGGVRMRSDVTTEEVGRLARAMTWKNALADIPFGGAKAGIVADDRELSASKKEELIRNFARRIKLFIPDHYISGPDMNMGEQEMVWMADEIGVWEGVTGKPSDYCTDNGKKCGLPHELGSTGFGVAQAAKVAFEKNKKEVDGATVAIAGFGNVGQFAAKYLAKMGARIVALSDSRGVLYSSDGLPVAEIIEHKKAGGAVADFSKGGKRTRDDIYGLDVDVLIPAAGTDVIGDKNIDDIQASVIVEGANIPMQKKHEKTLYDRGVLIVPDIIANAGGVISSYAEYKGMSEEEMFALVEEKITVNTAKILKKAEKESVTPRNAALTIAKERVMQS